MTKRPLKEFDFSLVQPRIRGLSFNIERDLRRMIDAARGDKVRMNELGLMYIFNQFAMNALSAVLFLTATSDDDWKRKPNYVLVVPAINRQLLDLLFTVVYMFDDYEVRIRQYDRASYRSAAEDMVRYEKFAGDPETKKYLAGRRELLDLIADVFGITPNERARLKEIDYWPTPTQIVDQKTKSRPFLRWINKWLYSETSEQAHLSAFGINTMGALLVEDISNDDQKELLQQRLLPMFHAAQVTRTAFISLAIMSEIDTKFNLGNRSQAAYIWRIFAEYAPEAKDMYEERYKLLTAS